MEDVEAHNDYHFEKLKPLLEMYIIALETKYLLSRRKHDICFDVKAILPRRYIRSE